MPTLATLAGVFALLGCHKTENDTHSALPLYTVGVEKAQVLTLTQTREWVGQLAALVSAPIMPQINGYIGERLFTNGQMVHQGQILYKIDDTRYAQALTHAQQEQEQAQAQYDEAAQNVTYYKPLVERGAVSRQMYTEAVQQAQAASATLAAAKTSVQQQQTNVDYCTLSSPVDGIAGFAQADIGSYVTPNSTPLVTINQVNPIKVYFSISEQDWLKRSDTLHPGAQVRLILADGTAYPHPAVIVGVDNEVKTATGSIMIDAHAPNGENILRPGMYVRVRATVGEEKNALTVPVGAVCSLQGQTYLVIIASDNKAELRAVTTGLEENGRVAILQGLSTDERIVVRGTQQAMMAAENRARLRVEGTKN